MYIVVIAWLYVAVMMAVAEATSPIGTVLGAVFTFLLYGAAPVALLMYLLGAPGRRQRLRVQEAAAQEAARRAALAEPDAGSKTPADAAIAPVREKP